MIDMPQVPVGAQAKQPVSNVKLFSGVPWDDQYRHVRKFNSILDLDTFLESKKVAEMEHATPIRIGNMELRINLNEFQALHVNYLSFINRNMDNRTHYAFIQSAKALSDNSTTIYFELDVWTENQFDLQLKPCFVEREIIPKSADTIGAYTFPDDLEIGEYKQNKLTTLPTPAERQQVTYVTTCSFDPATLEVVEGKIFQKVYSGIGVSVAITPEAIGTFIKAITEQGKSDGIVNVVQSYGEFTGDEMNIKHLTIAPNLSSIDGYVPKNNKAFTYPYNFLTLDNNQGAQIELRYEDFNSGQIELTYSIAFNGGNPVLYCYPNSYLNVDDNYDYCAQFTGFPQCAIATDFYKAWLAQNATAQNLKMAGTAVKGIGGAIAGAGMAGIGAVAAGSAMTPALLAVAGAGAIGSFKMTTDLVNEVISFMGQKKVAEIQPPDAKTTAGNGVNWQMGNAYITLSRRYVKAEYIRKVDDFWTMFGYPIGRIKTPDITSRPSWNYCKTKNATFGGNLEHQDLLTLRQIFDNGVTVWHVNDVGNYDLDNT